MTGEVRNACLAFVGGVLVLIVADGSYTHYVRPGAGPLVLAAGLVILALAVVDAVRHARGGASDSEDDAHGGRVAWLMLVPVLTVLLVAPPSLGADAVGLAAGRAAPTRAATPDPLPPGPAPALAVVDFVSRADARDAALDGREVTLTGFLVGRDLARLVISCCAADASPVRVHLDPAPAPASAPPDGPDRWVTVRGTLVTGTGTTADGNVPTLRVVSLEPVAAPEPAYEY